jgi:hypothetical protein
MFNVLIEVLFGIVGIYALILYVKDSRKIEPRIIQTYQDVTRDDSSFLIRAVVSNLGRRTAKNCSVKIYVDNNPVEDLSFQPIDSLRGRIGLNWPKITSFVLHPTTPIMLRGYLSKDYEGKEFCVRLFSDGKKYDESNHFTLTA